MTVYAMNDNPDFIVSAWPLPEINGNDLAFFINDANTPAWAATLMTNGQVIVEAPEGNGVEWKIIFTDDPTMTAYSNPENVLCMRSDGTTIPEYNSENYIIWGVPTFYDIFTEVTG